MSWTQGGLSWSLGIHWDYSEMSQEEAKAFETARSRLYNEINDAIDREAKKLKEVCPRYIKVFQ